jgi:hypothetical protein
VYFCVSPTQCGSMVCTLCKKKTPRVDVFEIAAKNCITFRSDLPTANQHPRGRCSVHTLPTSLDCCANPEPAAWSRDYHPSFRKVALIIIFNIVMISKRIVSTKFSISNCRASSNPAGDEISVRASWIRQPKKPQKGKLFKRLLLKLRLLDI